MTPVLQVVHRAITCFLLDQAGLKADEARSGAVTLIQRFGSAANLNIHLHCRVLDGVYRCDTEGEPVFVEVAAPTDVALQTVLRKIITRMMKLLTRKGVLVVEQGQTSMADDDGDGVGDEARVLRPLHAAVSTYRIAFGPRAGQKVLTLQGAIPRETNFKQSLCADIDDTGQSSAWPWPKSAAPFCLRRPGSCGSSHRNGPRPTTMWCLRRCAVPY